MTMPQDRGRTAIASRRCSIPTERFLIAYQGEPGAYSEEAALGFFGDGAVEPVPWPTFSAVCAAVVEGRAAAAMLPLENSVAGTVGEAVDALVRARLAVVGEALLPIRHALLGVPGASLAGIRSVASHPQALAQAERYLAEHGWDVVVSHDTAGAARELAASDDRSRAVVASARAAERYGLAVLATSIADAGNVTRFAVAAASAAAVPAAHGPLAPPEDGPRASLVMFETLHTPGALHTALGALAEGGVNVSRIESRPTGGERWQYRFLVSVDGDAGQEPLRAALEQLRHRSHALRVLGSYPSAG
jgi:prephenate dehydratase